MTRLSKAGNSSAGIPVSDITGVGTAFLNINTLQELLVAEDRE
jgi:hypothetical protein